MILFAAYVLVALVAGAAMYFLCEAIEKAIEILEGDIDG